MVTTDLLTENPRRCDDERTGWSKTYLVTPAVTAPVPFPYRHHTRPQLGLLACGFGRRRNAIRA